MIKKIVLLSFLFFLIYNVNAQYRTGIGVRAGIPYFGLTAKQFISPKGSFDLWFSKKEGEGRKIGTLLYEYNAKSHSPNVRISNFAFIYGIGFHTSFYSENNNSTETKNKVAFGADVLFGVEKIFVGVPFTIGFDAKPYYDFVNPEIKPNYIDLGITLRYIFGAN